MTPRPLRSLAPRLPAGLLYGGDYNPEQWPEEIWREDVRLMRRAGVNLVSLAIFSWAKLEPRPGEFDFGWLDRIVALLAENEISICLATATASPPPWFSRAHPESLPVDASGVRLSPGSRQHYCPNSRAYRAAAARLITELARRYAAHPAVALWHVNNEIGCHSYECFCDVCAADFRAWLRRRHGTLAALNDAWGTAFWSQAYGDWEEILPPRKMLTFRNPGHVLDYTRFMHDSLRGLLAAEVAAIRAVDPAAVVTTNGLSFHRPVDVFSFYREVDLAAWDGYPDPALGVDDAAFNAFNHDLYRSARGGQPFLLMEQATTQVNWRAANALKPPGQMRALSYSAVAHGADAVMFFQWRASRAGAEKFHSGMVPHFGVEGSRVFAEVETLGNELKRLDALCGARTPARVALMVSWENRWALELESKPIAFSYERIVRHLHASLWAANVALDVVPPDAPLDGYDVVCAPTLYQLTAAQAESLRAFVARGGTLLATYFTGVVDESERIWLGGGPGPLRDVFGLAVEEWQPLADGGNALRLTSTSAGSAADVPCGAFADLLHLRGAEALATFARDFYAGRAAVTRHAFGRGEAIYLATEPERAWLGSLLAEVLRRRGLVAPVLAPRGVEAAVRVGAGAEFLFVVNHTRESQRVDFGAWAGADLLSGAACAGATTLEPFGVRVVRRDISA